MWFSTFAQRLESWQQLRHTVQSKPAREAAESINTWWFHTPWSAYHLHWDDQEDWPDPWQLLSDNIYCPVARGLGILYTVTMIDHPELQDAVLIDTGADNLVLIDQEKYILNWDQSRVLNIDPGQYQIQHSLTQQQVKQQTR
jgi:hypothetical protein